jgi:hypothetical protein
VHNWDAIARPFRIFPVVGSAGRAPPCRTGGRWHGEVLRLALDFALLSAQPLLDGRRIVCQNACCHGDPAALVILRASDKHRGFSVPCVKPKNAPRQGARPHLQRVSRHMDSKSSPGDSLPQRILRIELTNGEVLCSLSPGTSITYKGRLVNPPKPARMDKINRIQWTRLTGFTR